MPLTRTDRRRAARTENKSEDDQILWIQTIFARYALGKNLKDIEDGLKEFFHGIKREAHEDVLKECERRIRIMIDNQQKKDEDSKSNPTSV